MEPSVKSSSTEITSSEEKSISSDIHQQKPLASLTYSNIKTEEGDTERSYQSPIIPNFPRIDKHSSRFPYCIVWTPIPCITTILPFIGHTGICNSSGVIHDFAGSYYVGINSMAFGSPCKYVQLNPSPQEMED